MKSACKEHGVCANRKGYGVVRHNGKNQLAHRIAYCESREISIDQIKGMVIRHTCDNARCIEPSHLMLGTQADNVRDMIERGRQKYSPLPVRSGTDNPMSKLDYSMAKAIRSEFAAGASQRILARKYGVSQSAISYVISGDTWNEAVGEINAAIAPLSITADGLASIGFASCGQDRAAKLYNAADLPLILRKLSVMLAATANRADAA